MNGLLDWLTSLRVAVLAICRRWCWTHAFGGDECPVLVVAASHGYEDLHGEERDSILAGRCVDCGGIRFFEGPHAGMGVNWECANPHCGSRYNLGPLTAQRISPPHPLRVAIAGGGG